MPPDKTMPVRLQRLNTAPPALEQRSIQLADKLISYTLKRSTKRRSIGLQINDQGLTVSMPLRASEKWLHSVLQDKAQWVVEKLESWQSKKAPLQKWEDGEPILFRGETFTLRVISSLFNAPPQLTACELIIHVADASNQSAIKKTINQWYRREAERVFEECVAHFAPLMNVSPREIKLTSARTQWGSCTSLGVVRLNWQLVTMPLHLIDYVVVHELAHLLEMNHSAAFWSVVQSVCPDYAKMRGELRKWSLATPEL
jgi:predicted metal-dependent hydrolase